jgi:hypothetical protein
MKVGIQVRIPCERRQWLLHKKAAAIGRMIMAHGLKGDEAYPSRVQKVTALATKLQFTGDC